MLLSVINGEVHYMMPTSIDEDTIIDTLDEGIIDTYDYSLDANTDDGKVLISEGTDYKDVSGIIHNYETALAISAMNLDTPYVTIWYGRPNIDDEPVTIFISGPGGREGVTRESVSRLTRTFYSSDPITVHIDSDVSYIGVPRVGIRYALVEDTDYLGMFFDPDVKLIMNGHGNIYSEDMDITTLFDTNVPYTVYIVRRYREYIPTVNQADVNVVGTYKVKGVIRATKSDSLDASVRQISANIIKPYNIRPISQFSDVDIIIDI